MATRPLPTFATDQQGRPVKQKDSSEALLKKNEMMLDIQKVQLDIFSDIRGIMRNIAENVIFVYSTINEIYRQILKAQGEDEKLKKRTSFNAMDFVKTLNETIENSLGKTKNSLAEKEKERESGLAAAPKKEGMFDQLKKLFEEYFGIFKTVFNIIKAILIPMVLGFVIGFRKKFDLLSVAITLAILYPIKTFKLMVRVFGFLFEALKGVGRLISKIGPEFKNAVEGITNFFRRMRVFFLRTLDLGKILQPIRALFSSGGGIFKGLAKLLGGLFRVLGKAFLPITILLAIFDGVMGAIEGYKKGGVLGAIKGALIGIIDGLVGWLIGIGQWIVSNLLELFGFDELAKIVDQFDFKKFLEEYGSFFMPILGLLDLFDESSKIRQTISSALDNLSNVDDFIENIWDSFTEAIRDILIKLGEALPGGDWLLNKLGIKKEEEKTPIRDFEAGKAAAVKAAIEDGKSEEEIQAIRNATNEEELRAATKADLGDKAKAMAKNPLTYLGPLGATIAAVQARSAKSEEIMAAEATNKAEQLDEKTKEANKAKQPEPAKPAVNNTTVIDASNNSKTTANMNSELHAGREGIGSRGNAGFSRFSKAYT